MTPAPPRIDPDFSREILEEVYAYRRKRRWVAWLLWGTLGWLGAHRFYLNREFTGLVMLFTGGGGLLWWMVDAFLIGRMVDAHNDQQELRERKGLPPREMDFMPPVREAALRKTPAWIEAWHARSPRRRTIRFVGDVLVLVVAGTTLGTLAGMDGALEAIVAVLILAGVTAMGAGPRWLDDVPVVRGLVRWSHRLRLFYYMNRPGSPPALLLRSVIGLVWAPFQPKVRAEVKLYVELGAVFTGAFLLLDVGPEVVAPLLSPDRSLELWTVATGFLMEALTTFFLIYAFAAPIGAVLTLYLLVRATHTVPRGLAILTFVVIVLGAMGSGVV